MADALSLVVSWVIKCAPIGIMGLVFNAVSTSGLAIFKDYGTLVLLLVCSMLFTAFVINAVIVGIALKRNPYPLILYCMKRSALTAFFTRSSAAKIPVNMDGAAVVITTLTLVAAHTTGVKVSLPMAIKRIKREKPRRRGASLFKRKDGYGRAVGYVSCLLGAESEGSRPQHAQQYDQNQRDDLFDIIHFQFPLIRLCGSDDPAFHFAFK